jgi:hypothetical protein
MIKIYVRDCNGKRETWEFNDTEDFLKFYNENCDDLDEDDYEIQIVIYDGYCIYSYLAVNDPINFEDLCCFFA